MNINWISGAFLYCMYTSLWSFEMTVNSSGFPHVPCVTATRLQPNLEQEYNQTTQILPYILYPIGAIAFLLIAAALMLLLLRKKRIDRLRHHLMPLYNFEGTDDDQAWEAELLDISDSHRLKRGYKSTELQKSKASTHFF